MKNTQGFFAQFPQLFWEFEILLKAEAFIDEQDLVRREEVERAFPRSPDFTKGGWPFFLSQFLMSQANEIKYNKINFGQTVEGPASPRSR